MMLDPAGLALIVVAGVILIVIIFFFSYFNTLMLIANFTYPNARIKARGVPFIKKSRLKKLVDSGTKEDFIEALRTEGYSISAGETENRALENAVEREIFDALKSSFDSIPNGAKPFFDAYLRKYDAEAVKRVIRAKKSGRKISSDSFLLHRLDRKVIEDMIEASTAEDAKAALQGTEFQRAHEESDDFSFEFALDRAVFEKMGESVSALDGDVSKKVKRMLGAMTDIMNIKMVLRAKNLGISPEKAMKSLFAEGREAAEWRLKNMAEAGDISSAIAELSGTSYGEILKGAVTVEDAEIALDAALLRISANMAMENSLDIGPSLLFFTAKDMELRNLKAVNLAIENGMTWADVEDLLITEADE